MYQVAKGKAGFCIWKKRVVNYKTFSLSQDTAITANIADWTWKSLTLGRILLQEFQHNFSINGTVLNMHIKS